MIERRGQNGTEHWFWLRGSLLLVLWLAGLWPLITVQAQPPPLPPGLEESEKAKDESGGEPQLPTGLEDSDETMPFGAPAATSNWRVNGFWDARAGVRLQGDPHSDVVSLAETRLQLALEGAVGRATLKLTIDFVGDAVEDAQRARLESGRGWLDLREASISVPLLPWLDAKIGRQVLTWGVGDLVFLNDLFPKDFNAFFSGRDVSYLKAPSDAVRLSAYNDWLNVDVIYTPRFDADRFLDGRRLSFFNPALGRLSGEEAIIRVAQPDDWFADDEWATRLHRTFGAWETAAYLYRGYWKSPAGIVPPASSDDVPRFTFPRLRVYGASARGPAWGGIVASEFAWYLSADDRSGRDPFIRNSEARLLLGYEREIATDVSLGLQYNWERLLDWQGYTSQIPLDPLDRDRNRHVFTSRLTILALNQNLTASLFAFVSPSDADFYLRPSVSYKASDHWTLSWGANLFGGKRRNTFFNQLADNSNTYIAVRYGF